MKVSLLAVACTSFLETVQHGFHVRLAQIPIRLKGIALDLRGGPCRWHGDTSLHKRSNGAELRDGAQRAGKGGD